MISLKAGRLSVRSSWPCSAPSPISLPYRPNRSPRRWSTPARRGGRVEFFNLYLRSLDLEREGLPAGFRTRLLQSLSHYGVSDLERTPELEEAVLRIFIAHQRRAQQVPLVTALLRQRLESPGGASLADAGLRDALDRLIETTQRRLPTLASLGRGVRHHCFDRPHVDRARAELLASMRRVVAEFDDPTTTSERHTDELVACPFPVLPILAMDDTLGTAAAPGRLLEILTLRYYKIRALTGSGVLAVEGTEIFRTSYQRGDRSVHVIAVRARDGELADALRVAGVAAGAVAPPSTVVLDVYLTTAVPHGADGDVLAARAPRRPGEQPAPAERASGRLRGLSHRW